MASMARSVALCLMADSVLTRHPRSIPFDTHIVLELRVPTCAMCVRSTGCVRVLATTRATARDTSELVVAVLAAFCATASLAIWSSVEYRTVLLYRDRVDKSGIDG
jgi:hypothetical protein